MTAITRSDDVRRRNRAVVLAALRRAGRLSRTEIASQTGLSASTVSAITSDLIAEGVLVQAGDGDGGASRRGRPQVALGLDGRAASIVAVVLSMNALSAALIDYSGAVLSDEQKRIPTLRLSREALIAETVGVVRKVVESGEADGRRIVRVLLAIQGITDSAARTLLWTPIAPHENIPFADIFEREFGAPATAENDCNLIAIALRARKPERYGDNFVAMLLSHGIGMGLAHKGEVFTGWQSSGGEIGHMIHVPDGALCRCGRRGCVEAYAGNYAVWRNARLADENAAPLADIGDEDMLALMARARAADGPERAAFEKAGEAIGFALGNLFTLTDAAPVALVGIGARAFDLLEGPMRAAIGRTAGGRHSAALSFESEPNELPLIREGCALRALTVVDQEIFAPGNILPVRTAGRNVA